MNRAAKVGMAMLAVAGYKVLTYEGEGLLVAIVGVDVGACSLSVLMLTYEGEGSLVAIVGVDVGACSLSVLIPIAVSLGQAS